MKLKLAIDVDGTLHNHTPAVQDYLRRHTKEDVGELTSYFGYYDMYVAETVNAAYRHACGPESMADRLIYPGVQEAMQELHTMGIELVVVSHNSNPGAQYPPLREWLEAHIFGSVPFKLCVLEHHESKVELMRVGKMFGIIDDKYDIVLEAGAAGLFAATIKQPYNTELLWEPTVRVFEDWGDVPNLVDRWLRFHS